MINDTFPSAFALRLATQAKIVLKKKHALTTRSAEYYDGIIALQEFQNMAISCGFKDALLAFHGFKISKEQKKVLKTIYKSSKPFLLGANVATMVRKLESPLTTGKDAKEITAAIVEHLQGNNGEKGAGSNQTNAGYQIFAAPIPAQS